MTIEEELNALREEKRVLREQLAQRDELIQQQQVVLAEQNALLQHHHERMNLYWLLGSSVQKQALRDGERSAFPACKHSRGDVESDVVNSILMLEHRSFHMMEKLLLWLVFLPLSCG